MAPLELSMVPEAHRDGVSDTLESAFGHEVSGLTPVTGGASGALTYRVESADGPFLLRVETIRGPLRNPHQYTCMQIAAEAGIAPPIRHLDEDAGIVVLPFLSQRPLSDFPGGPSALAAAAAQLLARLHETPTFPSHGDRLDNVARMLEHLPDSGRVAPGLLDRHAAAFDRIRGAYPWRPETFVSCHNDPNQQNMLFDGDRLWLIDWETASRSDPFFDAATVATFAGPTPELRDLLLATWLGRAPDTLDRARLALMTRVVQLHTGCILLLLVDDPDVPTHTDLAAMPLDQFRVAIELGQMTLGTPTTNIAFAKIVLGMFTDSLSDPDFDQALGTVATG